MPKIIDRDAYRKQMLDTSFQVLAQKGYAFPMRQIAATLGVSTGTLYHYFPSKRVLFEQVSEHIVHKNIAKSLARIASELSRAKRASILIDILIEDCDELTALVLLSIDYARLVPRHEMSEFFTSFLQNYAKNLSELLQISEDLSHFIIAAADGILLHNWINPTAISLQQRLYKLRDLVLVYLAQTEEGGADRQH
jgi:AcrR family transcriptional regulator